MKKAPSISVQLVHIHGPLKGEIQEFREGLITIGRHPSCTIRFPADMTSISRKHAQIRREGNQFKLTDMSSNGTFLNGRRVSEAFLKDGDVLEIAAGGPKFSFLTMATESTFEEGTKSSCQEPPGEQSENNAPTEKDSRAGLSHNEKPVNPDPQPAAEVIADLPVERTKVPLIIQYGPTIRSFKELPVTIGKNPKCEFVLPHPAILDQHAQIFFSRNQYWIKDLTGQNMVRLNGGPMEFQAQLNQDDNFSLSPQGPVFCFMGQGRLAEVVQQSPESLQGGKADQVNGKGPAGEKSSGSFWSKLKK